VRVKTEEKRQEILATAMAVFRERGYAAASMAEISARLGGSKGTLYGYFNSKEELFVSAMVDMARRSAGPFVRELEHAADMKAALVRFIHKTMQLLCSPEAIDFKRMLVSEGARSQLGKLAHEQGAKRYMQKFADLYAEQMREGRFRKVDPWQAAVHMHSLCNGGHVELVLEGVIERPSDEELATAAQAAADVFLRAYAIDQSPQRRAGVRSKRKPSRTSR
jgi:AcrR family transcriptional regulator